MKQFIHLKLTIIPSVTGPIRYSPLARVFLLAAVLFACLPLSQTARAANPAPGTPATSASGGAINGVQNFSNTALLRPTPTTTTFDAPGAGTGPFQGTFTIGINTNGAITGWYVDAANVNHAFVRASDGTITTFDVPGAGTGPFQGTSAQAINGPGAVTGEYVDAGDVNHGFVRASDGNLTTFDVPGAGTGSFQGTIPLSNNPANVITGYYIDANNVTHGFLRTP